MMTLLAAVLRLSGDGPWFFMTLWDLGFFVPLLATTLYLSTKPDSYRMYQGMLALSGAASGLVVASLYFRPTLLGMPSYFAMEIAWIFGVWLILGLRFAHAAVAALIISFSHIYGILNLDYQAQVLLLMDQDSLSEQDFERISEQVVGIILRGCGIDE